MYYDRVEVWAHANLNVDVYHICIRSHGGSMVGSVLAKAVAFNLNLDAHLIIYWSTAVSHFTYSTFLEDYSGVSGTSTCTSSTGIPHHAR